MKNEKKHISGMLVVSGLFAAVALLAPATRLPAGLNPAVAEQHDVFAQPRASGTEFVPITLHDIGPAAAPVEDANPLLRESGLDRLKARNHATVLIRPSMLMDLPPPPDMELDEDRRHRRSGMGIDGLRGALNGNMHDSVTEKPGWGWLADDVFSPNRNSLLSDDYAQPEAGGSR